MSQSWNELLRHWRSGFFLISCLCCWQLSALIFSHVYMISRIRSILSWIYFRQSRSWFVASLYAAYAVLWYVKQVLTVGWLTTFMYLAKRINRLGDLRFLIMWSDNLNVAVTGSVWLNCQEQAACVHCCIDLSVCLSVCVCASQPSLWRRHGSFPSHLHSTVVDSDNTTVADCWWPSFLAVCVLCRMPRASRVG